MTEKRFELKWRDTGEVLYDNETGLEHRIYSPDYRFHVRDMMNELAEENQRLKNDCSILVQSNQEYRKENEQLKERNNRQAKQLDNLYNLIEKENWKTLKGLIQEFQECEKQLQREWKCYE